MTDYPNLRALARGDIYGQLSDWTHLREEATKVLKEIKQLRKRRKTKPSKEPPKFLEGQVTLFPID